MLKPRIWLLLLVALMFPFKGVMAAAGMLCHLGSTVPMTIIVQPHQHYADTNHDHSHAVADADSPSNAHDDGRVIPVSSSCALCSAVCSAPPLPASGPSLQSLPRAVAERFPSLAASRPSAVFGALERPPRTI